MRNEYTQELTDLMLLYNKGLEDINIKHKESFNKLIQMMKKFIEIHDAKWSSERRIEKLECKLNSENHFDHEDFESGCDPYDE